MELAKTKMLLTKMSTDEARRRRRKTFFKSLSMDKDVLLIVMKMQKGTLNGGNWKNEEQAKVSQMYLRAWLERLIKNRRSLYFTPNHKK